MTVRAKRFSLRAFVGSVEPPYRSNFLSGRAIFPKSGAHFIGLRFSTPVLMGLAMTLTATTATIGWAP
ncbi:hypothetical protein, partial [Asticcacaulis sp.]|uniref:hypothetical protein n=1 Tax=Asticcacaulis sp. TaxID=1872648 RepID=UPI002622E618